MKQLILIIVLFAFISSSYSQEEEAVYTKKELKQIAKEEKKAKKEAEEEQMRELTKLMLTLQRFVLEADYVGNGKGQRIPVSSSINFISIDSTKAVIQLGTVYGVGYNGVGGITVEGKVTRYELKVIEGKKSKSYSLMFNVMSSIGIFDVTFLVSETGYTDATIRSNSSGQLRYTGNLVPISLSRVYKGTSIY